MMHLRGSAIVACRSACRLEGRIQILRVCRKKPLEDQYGLLRAQLLVQLSNDEFSSVGWSKAEARTVRWNDWLNVNLFSLLAIQSYSIHFIFTKVYKIFVFM